MEINVGAVVILSEVWKHAKAFNRGDGGGNVQFAVQGEGRQCAARHHIYADDTSTIRTVNAGFTVLPISFMTYIPTLAMQEF